MVGSFRPMDFLTDVMAPHIEKTVVPPKSVAAGPVLTPGRKDFSTVVQGTVEYWNYDQNHGYIRANNVCDLPLEVVCKISNTPHKYRRESIFFTGATRATN